MDKSINYSINRQTAIIVYSNIVIFFDFLIYFYLADTLNNLFFPAAPNALTSKLQTVAIFSMGYFVRPVGGLLIGLYGDTKGRKKAVRVSVFLIALTSLMTACLPVYSQVGIVATVLFIILRIIQGMAFGAQTTLGWVFIGEHAPRTKMGFYLSLVSGSYMLSIILTMLIFQTVLDSFTVKQFSDFTWRYVFIGSFVFSAIAFAVSHYLKETPEYLQWQTQRLEDAQIQKKTQKKRNKKARNKVTPRRFHSTFLTFLLSFYISSVVVTIALILPQLIAMRFSLDTNLLYVSNIVGLVFLIIGLIFYGVLADKSNMGRTLMLGSIIMAIQAFAFYFSLDRGGSDYILLMYALLGFSAGVVSLCPVLMMHLFPTKSRLASISVIYNATYGLVGGALPIGLTYATSYILLSPAIYLSFVSMIGVMTGLYVYHSPKIGYLRKSTL